MATSLKSIRNELAAWILPTLPTALRSQIVGPNYSWKHSDLRTVATAAPGKARLLIAPANYGGQGYGWARAAETIPGVSAANLRFVGREPRILGASDFDVLADVGRSSHIWARRQRRALISGFTHVLIEAGLPITGALHNGSLAREVRSLQDSGIKVGLVCHGSDVRLPSKHSALEAGSPFHSGLGGRTADLEARAKENLSIMDSLNLPEFVSTPDLLEFRPSATWLPLVTTSDLWTSPVPTRLASPKPVVAHIPGSRPALKGTDSITPSLRRLEQEGLVEYRELTAVPRDQMPKALAETDLVVNQVGIGGYGTVAVEAMLSGRVVVAQVWDSARQAISSLTGRELPIVEASRETVYEVVKDIVTSPEIYKDLGAQSRRFALEIHSHEKAAEALGEFLDA